jgi:hypothetical protein
LKNHISKEVFLSSLSGKSNFNFILDRKYFELKKPKEAIEFQWSRLRVFDRDVCEAFYERIKDGGTEATVMNVTSKRKTKVKPLPMNTIEF